MAEALIIIIMTLLGLSAADVDGKSAEDLCNGATYDIAKAMYYEQEKAKDGGSIDTLGAQ